jgi:hypothetical protein
MRKCYIIPSRTHSFLSANIWLSNSAISGQLTWQKLSNCYAIVQYILRVRFYFQNELGIRNLYTGR